MVKEQFIQLAAWAAFGALALATFAEWLHARRVQRLGRLAFGPEAKPRAWTRLVPPLRVLAFAVLVWSLVVLLAFEGSSRTHDRNVAATRHLMVLLDVSPSMEIADAGENGAQTRRDRAAALLKSVMERANNDQTRITMACFYSDALLLVKECADRELIWNFADNLPLHIAFKPGKTSLLKSLNTAGGFVKDFPRKSVTFLVLTDGDTVPDAGLNRMPSSVADVLIVGVGSTRGGTFLDGHQSRQDNGTLLQLARRLGGHYHDGNAKQIPSDLLRHLIAPDEGADRFQISLRTLAIVTLAFSAALLCLLPVLLEFFGSAWRPTVATTRPAAVQNRSRLEASA
ncbi:MAG TPA: VWA domain-containing protein [Verrucomicrobiae bacterium]|nr:VWA domain-containing protein [Verrucomicrobiae bacterium]